MSLERGPGLGLCPRLVRDRGQLIQVWPESPCSWPSNNHSIIHLTFLFLSAQLHLIVPPPQSSLPMGQNKGAEKTAKPQAKWTEAQTRSLLDSLQDETKGLNPVVCRAHKLNPVVCRAHKEINHILITAWWGGGWWWWWVVVSFVRWGVGVGHFF